MFDTVYMYTVYIKFKQFKHLLNDSLSLKHFDIILWAVIDIFGK